LKARKADVKQSLVQLRSSLEPMPSKAEAALESSVALMLEETPKRRGRTLGNRIAANLPKNKLLRVAVAGGTLGMVVGRAAPKKWCTGEMGCCRFPDGTEEKKRCLAGDYYQKRKLGPNKNAGVEAEEAAAARANRARDRLYKNDLQAKKKVQEEAVKRQRAKAQVQEQARAEADKTRAQNEKFAREKRTFASTYPFCETGVKDARWECCSFPGAYISRASEDPDEEDIEDGDTVNPYNIYNGDPANPFTAHLAGFNVFNYESTVGLSKFAEPLTEEELKEANKKGTTDQWDAVQQSFDQLPENKKEPDDKPNPARTCEDLPATPLCQLFFAEKNLPGLFGIQSDITTVPCVYKPEAGLAHAHEFNFGLTVRQKKLVYTMVTRVMGLEPGDDTNCQHVDCDVENGNEEPHSQSLNSPFIGMSDEDLLAEYLQLLEDTPNSYCQSSETSCDQVNENVQLLTTAQYEMDH